MSSYLENFNYQILGPERGRRWVFLHGLMGSLVNWKKIVSSLNATERTLIFDQRGHGKSFQPATGYSPEDYADDLFLITQDLGWDDFILVGHSMGARNSLVFAARFPEKVNKLVMEDLGPEAKPKALDYYLELMHAIPLPFSSLREGKEFFLNQFPRLWRGKSAEPVEILGQFLYSNLIENAQGQAWFRFSPAAVTESVRWGRQNDHWEELRDLRVPTLIVRGQNSNELSVETFLQMKTENPTLTAVQIANAGHWVHYDQPEEFLRSLKSFVGGF